MKLFEYNPTNNKHPLGTSVVGSKVKYELKIAKLLLPLNVFFAYHKEGEQEVIEEMKKTNSDNLYFYYSISVHFKTTGHFWYYFKVATKSEEFYLEKDYKFDIIQTQKPSYPFLQLVHTPITTPFAFNKGIIYHIYVDSFCKTGNVVAREGLTLRKDWNGKVNRILKDGILVHPECFGGNIKGIISKLNYLKKLNVSTVYLSPIFEAHSCHKYNTANYNKIDSMFGTEKDFKTLIDKANELNISIILDGVFNHTGSDSIYFNKYNRYDNLGAFQSKESPYYNWYFFKEHPHNYESWWGIDSLPQTNDENEDYVNYICGNNGIIKKYMNMGIKGFRLDVVDELNDHFIEKISTSIKDVYKKALIVGEVWEDASAKIAYSKRKQYFLGNQLNSVTNYPIKYGIINFIKNGNLQELINAIYTILDQYPKEVQNNLMNILDTHDTARILTVFGASKDFDRNENYKLTKTELVNGIHLLKMASVLQYTLMGIPTLFYGTEAGIEGTGDPFCRACYPWGHENKELIKWYQQLGELRKHIALSDGICKVLYAKNNILIYERNKRNKKIVVAVNKSENDFLINLKAPMKNYFTGEIVTKQTSISKNNYLVLINK